MATSKEKTMLLGVALAGVLGVGLIYVLMPGIGDVSHKLTSLGQLAVDIEGLKTQRENLQMELQALGQKKLDDEGLRIRRYDAEQKDATIKIMLNGVMKLMEKAGTQFISLEPVETKPYTIEIKSNSSSTPDPSLDPNDPNAVPADPALAEGADPALADPALAADGTAPAPKASSRSMTLDTVGYQISVRGAYTEIAAFLEGVNQLPDLVEVKNISFSNELGRDRKEQREGEKSVSDKAKPIRLNAVFKFYILEKSALRSAF